MAKTIDDRVQDAGEKLLKKIFVAMAGLLFGVFIYSGIRYFPRFHRWVLNKTHKWLPTAGERIGFSVLFNRTQAVLMSVVFWLFSFLLFRFITTGGDMDFGFWTIFFGGLGTWLGYKFGKDAYEEWHLFKKITTKHPVEDLPQGFITEDDRNLVAIDEPVTLKVDVPSEPVTLESAVRLIQALTALNILVSFELMAHKSGFDFCIVVPKKKANQAESGVYSVYPQAKVSKEEGAHQFDSQPFVFPLELNNPAHKDIFWAPLVGVDQVKTSDPLALLLQPLSRLNQDERVMIQFMVRRAQYPYWRQEGEKLLYKNPATIWNFLGFGGMKRMATKKMMREQDSRFEQETHKVYARKLQQPLLEVIGCALINVADEARKLEITDGLQAALSQFNTAFGELKTLADETLLDEVWESAKSRSVNIQVPPQQSRRLMLLTASELAGMWHLPTSGVGTPGLVRIKGVAKEAPRPVSEQQGTFIGTNTYQAVDKPTYIADKDREAHMHIMGKTGVGKSTFLHNLIHQDIQAGKGIAVIDPHGDLVKDILEKSIPSEREKEVVVFDLADRNYPVGLSFFDISKGADQDQKERVVIHIINLFKRIFAKDWSATRMENALTAAICTLVEVPGANLMDVARLFSDEDFRTQAVQKVKDPATLEFWHTTFNPLSDKQQRQMANPIYSRIRSLYRLSTVRNITCQKQSLEFREIIDKGKIFLASMDKASEGSDENHLGTLLVSKFQIAGMSRANIPKEKRLPYYLYVDEVQNFVTTSLDKVLSEARKYGLSLTVAHQFLAQLKGVTLNTIMGNVGSTIIFQCGPMDATKFEAVVKPEFDAGDLVSLHPFEAVVKMRHQRQNVPAFSIKAPSPVEGGDSKRAERIRELSRQKYALKRAEVEKQFHKSYQKTEKVVEAVFEEPLKE